MSDTWKQFKMADMFPDAHTQDLNPESRMNVHFCSFKFIIIAKKVANNSPEWGLGPWTEVKAWNMKLSLRCFLQTATVLELHIPEICYGDLLCFSQSKTKPKAIICVLPQGGHLTGNNYVVAAQRSCLTRLCFYLYCLPFTWALKPFNYYHLIIITFKCLQKYGGWRLAVSGQVCVCEIVALIIIK